MKNVFVSLNRRRFPAALSLIACLTLGLAALLPGRPAQAAPEQPNRVPTASLSVRLRGHVPTEAVAHARALGRTSGRETLRLALALPLRDPAGLNRLLQRLYAPGDPLFHHFILPAEFAARFSPTMQTYDSVIAFARSRGLTVTATHPNRLLLDVSGPVSTVESAFSVPLRNYRAPDGRVFHAPDYDPAIPAALAGRISGVIGLQNATVRRPLHKLLGRPAFSSSLFSAPAFSGSRFPSPVLFGPVLSDPLFSSTPQAGSGPGGGLTPSDIKVAYNLRTVPLTGTGRTLALYELDGYDPTDIAQYEDYYGLQHVLLQNILVGQADGSAGPNADEVTLDIELMAAVAPGVTKILVYEGANGTADLIDTYSRIADDNLAKEISTSWGATEITSPVPVEYDTENTAFQQMAAQGQSIYAASGDAGAYNDTVNLSVDDPASQPYMVAVGGTTLATNGTGGTYRSERAWGDPNEANLTQPLGAGSGGGVSGYVPLPDYQQGLVGAVSTTQRNVPDVCLNADPNTGYSIYYGGGWAIYGGTSCAAPLWAAFTALVNQQRAANGETDLGFANPTLYQIAAGPNYATAFHDITTGDNLFYPAAQGYDNATGLGSFNGANLLGLLAPAVQPTTNPLSSLTLDPNPVVGGLTVTGTVTLVNPAPAGGSVVTLTSASPATATVPASVTVPAGATTATFSVATTVVQLLTTVNITATLSGGTQSAVLTVQPPPAIVTPTLLSVNPASVNGGQTSTATLTLSGPAPSSGLTVTLSSSDPAATVPATVAVPAGAVSVTFPVTTIAVTVQTPVTLSATLNNVTVTTTLTVLIPTLEPIALAPATVTGGQSSTATLTLTAPAPTGGAVITLSSDTASVVLPASVTLAAGQSTASVTITTSPVLAVVTAQLKAAYNGVEQKATLTVKPAGVSGLTLAPASLTGGASSTATLTLSGPAPSSGLTVALSSSDPAATLPATVTFAPGAATATFTVVTSVVPASVTATITATVGTTTQTAVLTILPYLVTDLTVTPQQVIVGTPATGTLTVSAPAPPGGLAVPLTSSSAAATVPATVLVPAGTSTATFPVATPLSGTAVLSAVLGGQTQSVTLTVSSAPGTSYPAGLSMISAPYDETGFPLDTLFGYSPVKLLTWLPAAAQYVATPTAPADELHLGRGYWVNLPSALTLTHLGTPADPTKDFPIALSAGWNQIGNPFLVSLKVGTLECSSGGAAAVSFSQATSGSPLLVSSLVYRYVPAQGTVPGSYAWVRDTESLQPGLGYWIFAYSDVTLIVPHP